MVDDNDDSTLATAKREQLYTSADYGKLASMLKWRFKMFFNATYGKLENINRNGR